MAATCDCGDIDVDKFITRMVEQTNIIRSGSIRSTPAPNEYSRLALQFAWECRSTVTKRPVVDDPDAIDVFGINTTLPMSESISIRKWRAKEDLVVEEVDEGVVKGYYILQRGVAMNVERLGQINMRKQSSMPTIATAPRTRYTIRSRLISLGLYRVQLDKVDPGIHNFDIDIADTSRSIIYTLQCKRLNREAKTTVRTVLSDFPSHQDEFIKTGFPSVHDLPAAYTYVSSLKPEDAAVNADSQIDRDVYETFFVIYGGDESYALRLMRFLVAGDTGTKNGRKLKNRIKTRIEDDFSTLFRDKLGRRVSNRGKLSRQPEREAFLRLARCSNKYRALAVDVIKARIEMALRLAHINGGGLCLYLCSTWIGTICDEIEIETKQL